MAQELNDYEKARLRNIRKNEEILAALNLPSLGLSGGRMGQEGSPAASHQGKSKAKPAKEPLDPKYLRRSSRLRSPAGQEEGLEKGLGEKGGKREAEAQSLIPSKRPRLTGNLPFHDVSNDSDTSFVPLDYFTGLNEIKPISRKEEEGEEKEEEGEERKPRVRVKKEESVTQDEAKPVDDRLRRVSSTLLAAEENKERVPRLMDPDQEDHQETWDRLVCTHRHQTVKVVSKRVYSTAFHPQPQPLVVAAGDKEGNLGLWRVHGLEGVPEEATEKVKEKGPTPLIHSWRPHYNAIVDLEWVDQGSSLLTAAYDTSIRRFDPGKEMFEDVWEGDEEEIGLLASMDATHYPVIWYSTHTGKVGRRDVRVKGGDKEESWDVLEDKIGCLQLNPRQTHYLATASRDRAMRIWDIRALKSRDSEALVEIAHGKSVTSAYWDPSGTRVVTTSHDNHVRVFRQWDGTGFQDQTSMHHDNQTGR